MIKKRPGADFTKHAGRTETGAARSEQHTSMRLGLRKDFRKRLYNDYRALSRIILLAKRTEEIRIE
jgi:hypothetical protein